MVIFMSLLKIEVENDTLSNTLKYVNSRLSQSENTLKANFNVPCYVSSKLSYIKKNKSSVEFYYDLKVHQLDHEGRKRKVIFS